ncbi:MAG: PTS sugar transporter subunit IIA [Verrucomicrobiota bacterium]|nr:PTS sugar transporter subunit IIA [Verrucomicrobiota bacterium]
MDIIESLTEKCIKIGSNAKNKSDILREIAKLAKKSKVLDQVSEDVLFKALSDREEIGSTGFEKGLAIPHCRLKDISEFVVGILCIPEGIDFVALDGEKTKALFFIIAPEGDRNTHVRILSTISRLYSIDKVRKEILQAGSTIELREAFLKHVPDNLKPKDIKNKCIFNIVIQNENKFDDILELLSSLAEDVSIIEAKDIGTYLYGLPVFSSFWNSEDKGFHRIATGTISKDLANELLRSIDLIAEDLEQNSGITITIQELMIASGSLNN